jgi:hypothetical protein
MPGCNLIFVKARLAADTALAENYGELSGDDLVLVSPTGAVSLWSLNDGSRYSSTCLASNRHHVLRIADQFEPDPPHHAAQGDLRSSRRRGREPSVEVSRRRYYPAGCPFVGELSHSNAELPVLGIGVSRCGVINRPRSTPRHYGS